MITYYEQLVDRNKMNEITIDKVDKKNEKVYLVDDGFIPQQVKGYVDADKSIEFKQLLYFVDRYNIHISNSSLLKDMFDVKVPDTTVIGQNISTIKDYITAQKSQNHYALVDVNDLVHDNLIREYNRDSYESYDCSGHIETTTYITLRQGMFFAIRKEDDDGGAYNGKVTYKKCSAKSLETLRKLLLLDEDKVSKMKMAYSYKEKWMYLERELQEVLHLIEKDNGSVVFITPEEYTKSKQFVLNAR